MSYVKHYVESIDSTIEWRVECTPPYTADTLYEFHIWEGRPEKSEDIRTVRRRVCVLMITEIDSIYKFNDLMKAGDPLAIQTLLIAEQVYEDFGDYVTPLVGIDFKLGKPCIQLVMTPTQSTPTIGRSIVGTSIKGEVF